MFDSRQARRMLERMGVNMKEIRGAEEVIIKTRDKEIVVKSPSVFELQAKGLRIFQISGGEIEERKLEEPLFKEEDVLLVMSQTGVDRERAIAALKEANGDIALAIMRLQT